MNTRLQQFIAAENITQAQLADRLNVARAGVSHIIAGRNKPSYDFLTALMKHFPDLNIEWLMFGKGKMYKEKKSDTAANILFEDEEQIHEEVLLFPSREASESGPLNNPQENSLSSRELENLDEVPKAVEKQRNVKKIIILFDDGTFQEM